MNASTTPPHFEMSNPMFESLVQRIIQTVGKDKLASLRQNFQQLLRITLAHPDKAELFEDLWDFFYDWCLFEQRLPEALPNLNPSEQSLWNQVKAANQRGLYSVQRATDEGLKLKELYNGKTFLVSKKSPKDFCGISKGDIIESRILEGEKAGRASQFTFVRKPSYHPNEVHEYIKKKVRHFRKSQDYSTYQTWLWSLVGMYMKHRIYQHMPVEKIYDDNSRI